MGKGHRDNYAARLKRGSTAFKKKAQRRRGKYVGPWEVTFTCGQVHYEILAASDEIRTRAVKTHRCETPGCKPVKFERKA